MKRNKSYITVIFSIIMAFSSVSLSAQVSLDPNEDFYSAAREWQVKGLTGYLPQLKPYPVATVKNILQTVMEAGSESDSELAQYYYDKYFSKKWTAGVELGGRLKFTDKEKKDDKKSVYFNPFVQGDMEFFNYVSLGYDLGAVFQNESTETKEVLPLMRNVLDDTYDDPATFGSIVGNLEMTTNLAVGTESLYGMLGIGRMGYGPFEGDGIALNPTAYHSGNFAFAYETEKWQYAQTHSVIAASKNNGTGSAAPDKFLAFHSIRFTPVKQLAISYFESSVYGNRFDPCYFIPVPYMAIQGMYAESDNTMSGLQFEVRPVDRLEADIAFAIDDINTNGFGKGNFDSRLKLAMQAGISYAPSQDFCRMIALDYTLITPYTYSHEPSKYDPAGGTFNYDNYVNRNTCIGSSLPPDSDRVRLNINFVPVKRLKLDVFTTFVRHANALESISDSEAADLIQRNAKGDYATDGSVYTAPVPKEIQETNTFMKQSHKMYVVQAGFDAEYELQRTRYGVFSFNLGYTFEFIYNKGVDAPMYDGSILDPAEARRKWEANLHNEVNNYLSASVKYCY